MLLTGPEKHWQQWACEQPASQPRELLISQHSYLPSRPSRSWNRSSCCRDCGWLWV